MWIIKWLVDRVGSFFDILRGDMEWYTMYSPVMSFLILIIAFLIGILLPLPPDVLIYGSGAFFLVFGYMSGALFQKKMDNEPAKSSVMEEMSGTMPYVQFQAIIISIWMIYGIFIVRALRG